MVYFRSTFSSNVPRHILYRACSYKSTLKVLTNKYACIRDQLDAVRVLYTAIQWHTSTLKSQVACCIYAKHTINPIKFTVVGGIAI